MERGSSLTDLKSTLLGRFNKEKFIRTVQSDPGRYQELLRFSLSDEIPLGWRAAWILRHVLDPEEPQLLSMLPTVIKHIGSYDESKQREWLKILSKLNIQEDLEGHLYNTCVEVWLNVRNHSALRISAMQCIVRVIRKYPELKEELLHITQSEFLDPLTPGIRRTFNKLVSDL